MKTTAEIADEQMKAFTLIDAEQFEDDEESDPDVEEVSAHYIREQIIAALDADRAQRPTELLYDSRDLHVAVWPAHPDMRVAGTPEAIVVQIDTGAATGRIRVNLNDAPIWDGNPDTDSVPGAFFDPR